MKVIFRLLALILLSNLACNKDSEPKKITYDAIFQVSFTLDGVQYSKTYGKDTANPGASLGYMPAPGDYYTAPGARFHLTSLDHYIDIIVGFVHGSRNSDWPSTYESLKSNFAPGDKTYDHILYVPQTQPLKAEIIYSDTQGNGWSSTTYTYDPNRGFAAVINQPNGKFTITDMREIKNDRNEDGLLIVKGTFNCKLYEIDGPGVKIYKTDRLQRSWVCKFYISQSSSQTINRCSVRS